MKENTRTPVVVPPGEGVLTRDRIMVAVLAAATVASIYLCYKLLVPFLPAITWAVALAIVANPIHDFLCARMKRKPLAAAVAVLLVAIMIVLPLVLISQQLVAQATETAQRAKNDHWGDKIKEQLESNPKLAPAYHWIQQRFRPEEHLQRAVTSIGGVIPTVLAGSAAALVQLFIALFTLFFLFRDKGYVLRTLRSFIPLSPNEADAVFTRVRDTIHATVFGHVMTRLVQGFLGGLAFWFLGLPGPVLWGVVMAVVSLIPVLGAFVVWVPAAIYLLVSGHVVKAIIMTAWGALVIGSIDNFLYPVFVGAKLRLHTLSIFFSLLGGLFVFGMSGIVLGPAIVAITMALIDVWRLRTAHGGAAEQQVISEPILKADGR